MEQIIFILAFVVAIFYVFFLTKISDGWDETRDWYIPTKFTPADQWTIVIPFRNEEEHLPTLIDSLRNQDYPNHLLQIILVDDNSEDGSSEIAQNSGFTYLSLEGETGKKAALQKGVEAAISNLILATDADVIAPPTWVSAFASFFAFRKVDFVTGLVKTTYRPYHFWDAFQYLDFAGMMQVNASGIHKKLYFIANGANMAFRKTAFIKVGGLTSHQQIASGDDMFLIQAMADDPDLEVAFLKSSAAVVTTVPETSLTDLLQQRKRWATKTKHYAQRNITKVQAIVVFVHLIIVGYFIISLWTDGVSFFMGVLLLFIKWVMDYLFLAKVCRYYVETKPLRYFIPSAAFYFVIILASAFWSCVGSSYQWKGRNLKDY